MLSRRGIASTSSQNVDAKTCSQRQTSPAASGRGVRAADSVRTSERRRYRGPHHDDAIGELAEQAPLKHAWPSVVDRRRRSRRLRKSAAGCSERGDDAGRRRRVARSTSCRARRRGDARRRRQRPSAAQASPVVHVAVVACRTGPRLARGVAAVAAVAAFAGRDDAVPAAGRRRSRRSRRSRRGSAAASPPGPGAVAARNVMRRAGRCDDEDRMSGVERGACARPKAGEPSDARQLTSGSLLPGR